MADLGKVDRSFFEEHIFPRLGADRDDVALGPAHGVDFGHGVRDLIGLRMEQPNLLVAVWKKE